MQQWTKKLSIMAEKSSLKLISTLIGILRNENDYGTYHNNGTLHIDRNLPFERNIN